MSRTAPRLRGLRDVAPAVRSAVGLVWLSLRAGALHGLTYRVDFFLHGASSAINLATSLAFLAVVYGRSSTLAGWRSDELLGLWGAFYFLTGLLGAVVQPSMQRLMEDVRHGGLDFTLTKPADAQLLVSVQQVHVWRLLDAFAGIVLMTVAAVRIGTGTDAHAGVRFGASEIAAFAAALAAGVAIAYACCLLLATLTFWFLRIENALLVFLSFWETARWPVQIYPSWLRGTLTVLVPLAFATTVPAEALAGRPTPPAVLGSLAIAGVLLTASRWLWLRGLRHYAGASA